jgi:hypothetical protein
VKAASDFHLVKPSKRLREIDVAKSAMCHYSSPPFLLPPQIGERAFRKSVSQEGGTPFDN